MSSKPLAEMLVWAGSQTVKAANDERAMQIRLVFTIVLLPCRAMRKRQVVSDSPVVLHSTFVVAFFIVLLDTIQCLFPPCYLLFES